MARLFLAFLSAFLVSASGALGQDYAIKHTASDGIQFVSIHGKDSNDGLSWGTAKLTLYAALQSLPGGGASPPTQGSGTVYLGNNVTYGGPVVGGGLWLMGGNDPNYSMPPTGWLRSTPSLHILCRGGQVLPPNGHNPTCLLNAGSATIPDRPPLWLSATLGIYLENMTFGRGSVAPPRLSIDSNGNRNGSGGGIAGTTLQGDEFVGNGGKNDGPGLDIGSNALWTYLNDLTVQSGGDGFFVSSLSRSSGVVHVVTIEPTDFSKGQRISVSGSPDPLFDGTFVIGSLSDRRHFTYRQAGKNAIESEIKANVMTDKHSCILIDPGMGQGTGDMSIRNLQCNGGGGVKFYPGENGGGFDLSYLSTEDTMGFISDPGVWLAANPNYPKSTVCAQIWHVEISDSQTPVTPGVENDTVSGNCVAVNEVFSSSIPQIQGPATVLSQAVSLSGLIRSPLREKQVGFFGNRVYGQDDSARRGFSPVAIRFPNLAASDPARWTHCAGSGPITPNISAPDGTTGAVEAGSDAGETSICFVNAKHAVEEGDWLIGGMWARSTTDNGFASDHAGVLSLTGGDLFENGSSSVYLSNVFLGDGNWQWVYASGKVAYAPENSVTVAMGAFADANHTIQVYGPVFIDIPAGTTSDDEAVEIAESLQSYGSECLVGTICGLQGRTLTEDNIAPRVHVNQETHGTFAGTITTSSYATATLIFPRAYASAPVCVLTPQTTGLTSWYLSTISRSAFTVKVTPPGSYTFGWVCIGNPD